jgi:hypothetical protein
VYHHHDRVIGRQDAGHEGIESRGGSRQHLPETGEIGDAVLFVDLTPQEGGHGRVQTEALLELEDRSLPCQERVEERFEGAVLLEGAPGLGGICRGSPATINCPSGRSSSAANAASGRFICDASSSTRQSHSSCPSKPFGQRSLTIP